MDVAKGIRFLLIKYTNQSMRNRYAGDRYSLRLLMRSGTTAAAASHPPYLLLLLLLMMLALLAGDTTAEEDDGCGWWTTRRWLCNILIVLLSSEWCWWWLRTTAVILFGQVYSPWLYRAIIRYLRQTPRRHGYRSSHGPVQSSVRCGNRIWTATDNWGNGQMPKWHWVQGRAVGVEWSEEMRRDQSKIICIWEYN